MFIKASARPTAILVAGLLVLLAGPSPAAPGTATMLGESARMTSARASDLLHGAPDGQADPRAEDEILLVAADQLNDVDRSLREGNSQPPTSVDPPPAPVPAANRENSTWDQTSLIGKIFIGFGALLTMASAVRMFMA
jgi:hypothetical protein